jgi:hypothetical protein
MNWRIVSELKSCYNIFGSVCWSKDEFPVNIGSNVCAIKGFIYRLRGASDFRMVLRFSDALDNFIARPPDSLNIDFLWVNEPSWHHE